MLLSCKSDDLPYSLSNNETFADEQAGVLLGVALSQMHQLRQIK